MGGPLEDLPVVVIGAGPVGLAAAAHLHERGLPFTVLKAGDAPAAAVRQWAHVRLFSPWRYNVDAAARRLLTEVGWVEPDPEVLPTGGQLSADYLQPLADLPAVKPHDTAPGSPPSPDWAWTGFGPSAGTRRRS